MMVEITTRAALEDRLVKELLRISEVIGPWMQKTLVVDANRVYLPDFVAGVLAAYRGGFSIEASCEGAFRHWLKVLES